MSAYIVDPRTVDYLVAWAQRQNTQRSGGILVRLSVEEVAEFHAVGKGYALYGDSYLRLLGLTADELGQLLMDENVRSVRARYPNDKPGEEPGPCDQSRVTRYRFVPVGGRCARCGSTSPSGAGSTSPARRPTTRRGSRGGSRRPSRRTRSIRRPRTTGRLEA